MKHVIVPVMIVCLCVSMSYASWQNPLLLSELNDFEHGFAASAPTISSDEMMLIFTRSTLTKLDALWEARRNPETGVFDQQRQLAELKNGGAQVYGAWLSADKLRLYYAVSDPVNLGWGRRPIWMATRDNPDTPWHTIKRHAELEVEIYLNSCTLTADELHIMWMAAPITGGGVYGKIYTASRPSILHNFSNVTEATEFAGLVPKAPCLSADGLTVYFINEYPEWVRRAWVGHRPSRTEPFGNFRPLEEINALGPVWVRLCPSWDGKELYYQQQQGEPGDLHTRGIFVSEWVDDSFGDAIRNLHEAIAKKQHALELLTEATANEQTAEHILTTLLPQAMPAELNVKNLRDVLRLLQQSVNKETEAMTAVTSSIKYLQTALWILLPPLPVE